jgi:hypothetical protein
MNCHRLAANGLITRERKGGTIINRAHLNDGGGLFLPELVEVSTTPLQLENPSGPRAWSWEGNVQAKVVAFLAHDGWMIRRVANTATREAGRDIEAERDGVTLWVTVKGFPSNAKKGLAPTQARLWFASALFDVVLWRNESPTAQIVVALPTFLTYQRLAERTLWFESAAPFSYLWVSEVGEVLSRSGLQSETDNH